MLNNQFELKKAAAKAFKAYEKMEYKVAIELADKLMGSDLDINLQYDLKAMTSYCYMHLKEYQKGWELFSYRPSARAVSAWMEKRVSIPYWMGEDADYTDRTLLIVCEEGIGDELYHSACFHLLKGKFKKVYIECDARLIKLYERTYSELTFFPRADWTKFSEIAKDCNLCALLSDLPRFLNAELNKDLDVYLEVDKELLASFDKKLNSSLSPERLLVGISYFTSGDNKDRRMVYEFWDNALTDDNINWIDLQHNNLVTNKEAFTHSNLLHCDDVDLYDDIDSLAALISTMDYVLTIDNYIAHLAGRLGVNTIVLLPRHHNIRWDYGTGKSIWYNTCRILIKEDSGSIVPAV